MKVLLINGSPHEKGCTYTALSLIAGELKAQGIETEILHVGGQPVGGCIGCGGCRSGNGRDGILQRGRAFAGRNVSRRSGGNRGRNGRRGRREVPARRSNARIRGRQGRPGGRTRLLQAAAAAQGIGDDPLELAVDRAELVGSP